MNFDLTEDQTMLCSAVERYVADYCGFNQRKLARCEPAGFSEANWSVLSELGLVAAPLPATAGGMDLSPAEISIVFQELGRGLALEPLGDAIVGAACTFASCAEGGLAAEWADDLAQGRRRLTFAINERTARYNVTAAATRAVAAGAAVRLSGEKIAVPHAIGAHGFLVSAADSTGDVALYLVEADASGLDLTPYRQIDGSVAAVMRLQDVPALARLSGGPTAIAEAQARVAFAHCAEAVGIMSYLFDATLNHLRQRKQFGQPLGSFQALQHRMAAQYVALEQSRSLMYWALARMNGTPDEVQRTVAGLHGFVLDAAVKLGHEAIQLHGGMGVTDELAIGHAHKRVVQIARSAQPLELALDRYAGLLGQGQDLFRRAL